MPDDAHDAMRERQPSDGCGTCSLLEKQEFSRTWGYCRWRPKEPAAKSVLFVTMCVSDGRDCPVWTAKESPDA